MSNSDDTKVGRHSADGGVPSTEASASGCGWTLFFAAVTVLVMVFSLGSGDDDPGPAGAESIEQQPGSSAPDSPVDQMSALEQMEIAFVGGYSQSEIKLPLETAMRLYGLSVIEEQRSRAGSVLVALRKEYGVPEMEILDYMIRSYVAGVEITFADMAAVSVVALASGDS